MKNKWLIAISVVIIVLLATIFFFNNDANKYYKEISFNELQAMIEKEETFFLYIKQTSCNACKEFTPVFKKILNENKITGYSLNLTDLKENDVEDFENILKIQYTPTIAFFEDGIELGAMTRIEGSKKKDFVVNKLIARGFIKE